MNPYLVLGVTSGTIAAAGLLWLVRAFTTPARPARVTTWAAQLAARAWSGGRRSPAQQRRYRLIAAGTVAVALATWLISGLAVLGLVAAAAVPGLPWLLAAGAAERRAIAQLEAVAEWTRRLRDVSDVGTGLQSAIIKAAATAPAAIAGPVRMLAARLEAGADARSALRRFADEIADGTCDQVVATLLLHLSDRGEKLGVVLAAIAGAASSEVTVRKEADAERASARFAIRFMAWFALAVVAGAVVAGDYMAPYATGVGQVVMTTLAAGFITTLWWVRSLTRPVPAPRMLGATARSVPL